MNFTKSDIKWSKKINKISVEMKISFGDLIDALNEEFEKMGILWKRRSDEQINQAIENIKKRKKIYDGDNTTAG